MYLRSCLEKTNRRWRYARQPLTGQKEAVLFTFQAHTIIEGVENNAASFNREI